MLPNTIHAIGFLSSGLSGGAPSSSVLDLEFEGANGSTIFTDSSSFNRTVTPNGNAQISTAQFYEGASSGLFDGNGDYLQIAHLPSLNIAGSNFSLSFAIYFNTISSSTQTPISMWQSHPSTSQWLVNVTNSSLDFICRSNANPSPIYLSASPTFTANTWYFIELARISNVFQMKVNNSILATNSLAISISTLTSDLRIGGNQDNNSFWLDGYLDKLIFTID